MNASARLLLSLVLLAASTAQAQEGPQLNLQRVKLSAFTKWRK